MNFNILVDYDNVYDHDRRLGLPHVISKITAVISPHLPVAVNRLSYRLYGGWFEEAKLSRSAQKLGASITTYPTAANINGNAGVVQVDFARALFSNPRNHLTHTFRPRGQVPRLSCEASPYRRCTVTAQCPLIHLAAFINSEQCHSSGCPVTPADILKKEEQKLVDTMIVSDIAYLATQDVTSAIAVVSADYDIWPGIVNALAFGKGVVHVHPKPNYGIRRNRYAVPIGSSYVPLSF
ncbi:hypothetical protein [Hydrocarboniphaga effusa]|uniref:hypothetical protein n=1 Tax=Hydrocarboniphaga effusa TaxID=243629 RepID=UPI003BAC40E0